MSSKKKQIFKCALKLFTELGFHGTPTSRIAKEAGVATGTLFHHFKTKEDLINELYLDCKSSMIEGIMKGVNVEGPPLTALEEMCRNFVHWGIENREEFYFFQQFSHSPNISSLTREEGFNRFRFVRRLFERLIEEEKINDISPCLLMEISSGLITSIIDCIIDRNLSEEEEIEKLIDQGIRFFERGILK